MIDLARVHPVFNGRWHRIRLLRLPQPGEQIVTLCGASETAEYVSTPSPGTAQTCWTCDIEYRRQEGIPVLPTHPGLPPLPR
jgi:hypothetical protein